MKLKAIFSIGTLLVLPLNAIAGKSIGVESMIHSNTSDYATQAFSHGIHYRSYDSVNDSNQIRLYGALHQQKWGLEFNLESGYRHLFHRYFHHQKYSFSYGGYFSGMSYLPEGPEFSADVRGNGLDLFLGSNYYLYRGLRVGAKVGAIYDHIKVTSINLDTWEKKYHGNHLIYPEIKLGLGYQGQNGVGFDLFVSRAIATTHRLANDKLGANLHLNYRF